MKTALMFLAGLAIVAAAELGIAQTKNPGGAQQWFEKIKALEGDWVSKESEEVVVRYRVVAGGSAVVETDFPGQANEMVSVYHLDGDELVMQHYCVAQNQPRFSATIPSSGNTLEFKYTGGSNIDVGRDTHIHHGRITFEGKNRLRTAWTAYKDGKRADTHTFELTRQISSSKPLTNKSSQEGETEMARFLFVYRSSAEQHQKDISPEQMQSVMEAWNAWIGKGMQEGWMVDPGDALKLEGRIVNDEKVVSDGPFAESKEIVGGYSIVQAEDIEAASQFAKSCPHTEQPGGTVEIRELAGLASKE